MGEVGATSGVDTVVDILQTREFGVGKLGFTKYANFFCFVLKLLVRGGRWGTKVLRHLFNTCHNVTMNISINRRYYIPSLQIMRLSYVERLHKTIIVLLAYVIKQSSYTVCVICWSCCRWYIDTVTWRSSCHCRLLMKSFNTHSMCWVLLTMCVILSVKFLVAYRPTNTVCQTNNEVSFSDRPTNIGRHVRHRSSRRYV